MARASLFNSGINLQIPGSGRCAEQSMRDTENRGRTWRSLGQVDLQQGLGESFPEIVYPQATNIVAWLNRQRGRGSPETTLYLFHAAGYFT